MVALALLPLAYVLSMGPVIALGLKAGVSRSNLKTLYRPLQWLHDNTALKMLLEEYARLWGVK